MQTILVPTDFSENAGIATSYAVQLAKQAGARIVLFHVYHLHPPQSDGADMGIVTPDELEIISQEQLQKTAMKILLEDPSLNIECISLPGFASEEIPLLAIEKNADLIVMGIVGMGFWGDMIIGSNTINVIRKSDVPVLTVPVKANFNPIGKIVFAFDFHEVLSELAFKTLNSFIQLFQAEVSILYVIKEGELITETRQAVSGVLLENYLKDTKHSFHFIENKNVEEGILEFIKETQSDLLVMIPQKHTLFERIFRQSHSRKMAFQTSIPLLTISN